MRVLLLRGDSSDSSVCDVSERRACVCLSLPLSSASPLHHQQLERTTSEQSTRTVNTWREEREETDSGAGGE